jgi:hypothetical protein
MSLAELSAKVLGRYGAANGVLDLKLDIAPNDQPGLWELRAHDLASGLRTTIYIRVTKP